VREHGADVLSATSVVGFTVYRWLVVSAGSAPASSGYQPDALLLSYETMVNCGFAPNRFTGRNTRFKRRDGRIRITWFGL
jgi:hypothetical protein